MWSSLRLSEDVIHDILVGLPVKDVLRFRCLSKTLCTAIDSPDFVAAHLNRSRQTKSHRKLVFFGNFFDYSGIDLDLDLDDDEEEEEIHKVIKLSYPIGPRSGPPPPLDQNWGQNRILGSCNGLVLLHNEDPSSDSVLWNPFTRRYKKVPIFRSYKDAVGIGLGFNSATNNYKIVALKRWIPPSTVVAPPLRIRVQVFDVATNSLSEQVVEIPFPNNSVHRFKISRVGVFANGALHWIVHTGDLGGFVDVWSFDIANQVFVEMLPPIRPPSWRTSFSLQDIKALKPPRAKYSLQVLQGRAFLAERTETALHVYGAAEEEFIWTKLYQIDLMKLNHTVHKLNEMGIMIDPVKKVKKINRNKIIGRRRRRCGQIIDEIRVLNDVCGEIDDRKRPRHSLEYPLLDLISDVKFLEVKLLEYSKDGEKILLQYPADGYMETLKDLFWYDFQSGIFKPVHISRSQILRPCDYATFCVESLVPLGDGWVSI